jgi:hypothetical protein
VQAFVAALGYDSLAVFASFAAFSTTTSPVFASFAASGGKTCKHTKILASREAARAQRNSHIGLSMIFVFYNSIATHGAWQPETVSKKGIDRASLDTKTIPFLYWSRKRLLKHIQANRM